MITDIKKLRAEIEASKKAAIDRFERDWGTRDVRPIAAALRRSIPGSTSPADAARKAHRILACEAGR